MIRRMLKTYARIALTVAACALTARADVKLPALFSDNMVLQREKPIAIWGWADDGEKVTVKLDANEAITEARGGKWKVYLPKTKAGGPYTLKVAGNNTLTRTNVLIGEVWIC